MIGHQIGLLFFLTVLLAIALANWRGLRRLGSYPPPIKLPFASLLVPARNEQAHIEACLRSLLRQDYLDFEVLALDDDSSDDTASILARLAGEFPRLRVLRGQPLPPGWLGKPWACQQLSQAAHGELLLFTDADTHHHPQALRTAVAALMAEGAGLLSILPEEQMDTPGELLSVPLLAWSLYSLLPLGLAHRLGWPPLSAAIGQFMLFTRRAYAQAGGHAAVRLSTADDFGLARAVLASGGRWRLVDGRAQVICRMYTGFTPAWRGLSKSLLAAFGYQVLPFALAWLWMGIVFLEPPLLALAGLAVWLHNGTPPAGFSLPLALAALVLSSLQWLVFCLRLGYPRRLALLHPAVIALGMFIAGHSLLSHRSGKAEWKGRRLPAGS